MEMTTLGQALDKQDKQDKQDKLHILAAPAGNASTEYTTATASASSAAPTLSLALVNKTTSSNVYAYVTGLDINKNNAIFLLESDGVTGYYPTSPASDGTALSADVHIALGGPGTTRTVTVPQLAGGRVWVCVGSQLTFLLNEGPGLVEPSVTNGSDANYNLHWDFMEFTFNASGLFANITYVDFVSVPIGIRLTSTSGATQTVEGLPSAGLSTVCDDLAAQTASDGAGWSALVVKDASGNYLRALSPNAGIVMNHDLFSGYYAAYVAAVWSKYASTTLTLDTQTSEWGVLEGTVQADNQQLTFPGVGSFAQPSAADIFSCSTGPFAEYATNTAEMGNITARLAAAFNRSTLLLNTHQPDDEAVANYYQTSPTNHYARIVHAANPDGLGYAFPYDDVGPDGAAPVDGAVSDGAPSLLTVSFGGGDVSPRTGGRASRLVGGVRSYGPLGRRGLGLGLGTALGTAPEEPHVPTQPSWPPSAAAEEKKRQQQQQQQHRRTSDVRHVVDLEKAAVTVPSQRRLRQLVPAQFDHVLSMSVRTVVARLLTVVCLVLGSFLLAFVGRLGHEGV